jgi:hypothetical protein
MPAIGWRVPIRLARTNFHSFGFTAVTVFDRQRFVTHNYRYTMKRINMPGCCVPWLENQPPDKSRPALADRLLNHINAVNDSLRPPPNEPR